ncbi:MAG: polysaccharide deacetylase family protein [Lachnospiraceae bacterium]|nr:polysaccharide deacetylase family protein [Lachnospiraceae bacterium]
MGEEQRPQGDARRRRVQRLKRMIVLLVLVWMILPVGLSIVLLGKVRGLNRQIIETQEYLRQMEETVAQQVQMTGEEQQTGKEQQTQQFGRKEVIVTSPVDDQDIVPAAVEPEAAHKVYLTFDDGPSKYTEDILDILDTYDVKATFFVLGKENEHSLEMLKEIAERGHTIGMHSYSHKYADVYRSVEDFSADFYRIYSYILDNTGIQSTCYRFPGGSSNTISDIDMHVFADFLAEQEVEFYDWNISSGDAGSVLLDVDTLVQNCTADISRHGTSIILMHDAASRPTTVEALPQIIENILAMEDTVILPITEDTTPIHHIH